MLSLRLMGPLEILWKEKTVEDFPTDKIRALLVYLAVEPDRPHRRDHLATLFWSDFDDEIARRNLRQSLHRLRRVLEQAEEGLADRVLTVTRQSIELHSDVVWSDVIEITSLCQGDFPTDMDSALGQRWRQASRLVRGEFLEGFSLDEPTFDEWLESQRQHTHLQAMQLCRRWMRFALELRRFPAASEHAQQLLSLEAWDEEAHRVLMQSLAMTGQRAAALAQYERCCDLLDRELGVEPEDATLELLEQIQEGAFEDADPLPPPAQSSVSLPRQRARLVGREQDLQQLETLLLAPETRLVTLLGPGGIGKTRLALALAQRWQEAATPHPFAEGVYFVSLEGINERQRVPSLLAQSLGLTFEAKGDLEERLTAYLRPRRLLVIWDNVESLSMIQDFLIHLLDQSSQIKFLLTAKQPCKISYEHCFSVGELDEQHAMELFAQRALELDASFSLEKERANLRTLFALIGGYPLAIELSAEWVRLMDCSAIAQELARDLTLLDSETEQRPLRHRSMRGLMTRTWQQLSSLQQQAIQKLSIFSGSFSLHAARHLTEISLRILADLTERSFLQKTTVGRYHMRPLWRQFAQEQPRPVEEKEALQRAFTSFFLDSIEEQLCTLLGESRRSAREALRDELSNIRQAWKLAAEVGDSTALQKSCVGMRMLFHHTGLFTEGLHLFSQTKDTLQRLSLSSSHQTLLCQLLEAQAWFLIQQGQTAQAHALFVRSQEQVPTLPPPQQAERNRLFLHLLMALGDYTQALALFDQPDWQQELDPYAQLEISCCLGQMALQKGDYTRTSAVLEDALREARQRRLPMAMIQALLTLAMLDKEQGHLPQARIRLLHARELATQHALPIEQIRSLGNLGVVERHLGNHNEAETLYREGLTLSKDLGMRGYISHFLQNLGVLASLRGDFVQATDFLQQTLCLEEETQNQGQISIALGNLGDLYRQMGEEEKAMIHLQRSLALERSLGRRAQIAVRLGNLAEVERAQGNKETALGHLEEAIALIQPLQQRSQLSWLLLTFADICLEQGAYEAALAPLEEGLSLAIQVGRKEKIFEGKALQIQRYIAIGEQEQARQALERLEEQAESLEERGTLYWLRWLLSHNEEDRLAASTAFQDAYKQSPKSAYKKRLQQLSTTL